MASPLALTNEELQQLGIEALVERIGYEGTLRFLAQMRRGHGDYLAVQDGIWGDMTVEQIHEDAAAFERAHPELLEGKQLI
jgi:hypothetical protein